MNQLAFLGACAVGLALAGAVTWEATEPGASTHAKPVAAAPVASVVEPVASVAPVVSAEPELVGFDGGTALNEVPQLELTPPAPSSTKGVRFGVVLVVYAGAQGAPTSARSKADAQAMATRLAEQAKDDFKAAVNGGDQGSMADVGRIGRGVLEPEVESVLFRLEPGEVSGALDTPRGFWIVKRID